MEQNIEPEVVISLKECEKLQVAYSLGTRTKKPLSQSWHHQASVLNADLHVAAFEACAT